jgi:probable blue pigment (indigoidine) exporter
MSSMEVTTRWTLVTALAPIAWGTNYYVTRELLPADAALWGAAIRALPAGLLLLLVGRSLPRGSWWWRSAVLGALNVGAFFALIYVAAQLLPTSIASTIMAASPVALMLMAWALVAERPRLVPLAGAFVGIAGVAVMLLGGGGTVEPRGVAASVSAMVMSSAGYVLAKRWSGGVDLLASTSWQLVAGGLLLLVPAVVVEGAPPALDLGAALGFVYVSVVCTAVAFAAWFGGLRRLPASTVGLVGLLNPVTGVLLGIGVAGEALTWRQVLGMALVLVAILTPRARAGRCSPSRRAARRTAAGTRARLPSCPSPTAGSLRTAAVRPSRP